jgi:hypothetical protein
MITIFLSGRQKLIARALAWIFYLQFVLPLKAYPQPLKRGYEQHGKIYLPELHNLKTFIAQNDEINVISEPALSEQPNKKYDQAVNRSTTNRPATNIQRSPYSLLTGSRLLTGGPTQPEMQSFQSVNSNNMVDLFSGDFSYNIPLLDVGGYPVNLHYSSGITMDQEASWVGLGWNINPGTITRNMRGLPDDFNGTEAITKTQKIKDNVTIGGTLGGDVEIFGKSRPKSGASASNSGGKDSTKPKVGPSIGGSIGLFHNNYKGWGLENSLNVGISAGLGAKSKLTGSLGLNLNNNSQEGLDVGPSLSIASEKAANKANGSITIGTNYNSRTGLHAMQVATGFGYSVKNAHKEGMTERNEKATYGTRFNTSINFVKPSFTPKINMPFTSSAFAFTLKIGGELTGVHPTGYGKFYKSVQEIEKDDETVRMPAYGYLYQDAAKGQEKVLMDYNRDKEGLFRASTPNIAIPQYTFDTYTINGEGVGGMFRPYRGDVGYVFDNAMQSKSKSFSAALDLGIGNAGHIGVDLHKVDTRSNSGPWKKDNLFRPRVDFVKEEDSVYEKIYFKNPGEKTKVDQSFLDAMGGDDLVRAELKRSFLGNQHSAIASMARFKNQLFNGVVPMNGGIYRKQREKRVQHISFLTAKQASRRWLGLDSLIRSYKMNQFPLANCKNYDELPRVQDGIKAYRKPHHLSEITVLDPEGKRYVYGLPVYNMMQTDVSFSVANNGNTATGLVNYVTGDNTTANNKGQENFINKEITPAYAHSFLLSGILSPDYVDVSGDGITEDDMGDGVKFNYSQVYGDRNDTAYRWRSPYDNKAASYNEGLKTDSRDQQGSYSYGEREQWYLNSIESKTMLAAFVLDAVEREDGHGVLKPGTHPTDANFSVEDGGYDGSQKQYRLKEINLYAKADVIKNGFAKAKPIKTVHFQYSYDLCGNTPGSSGTTTKGKLTLNKVWFTYNKNNKGQLNPYTFKYHSNPSYNNKSYDRWGNYKDPVNNPGGLTNADHSYVLQGQTAADSIRRNNDVAAWTLNEIKLPSGAKIKVSYESDDYAYVQDKRATQFFKIAGFAETATGNISNKLYQQKTGVSLRPVYFNKFVLVRVPMGVTNDAALTRRYMEGITKFYFKLMVKMPSDAWGSGYEIVPCYTNIVKWGIRGNPADNLIWLEMGTVRTGAVDDKTPLATAAIQFLRLNLSSKAFPNSEPEGGITVKKAVGILVSSMGNIQRAATGFFRYATDKNWCSEVDTTRSFVRLNNPYLKKYGGGLRVSKVEIDDYWDSMTTKRQAPVPQLKAVYGQQYKYTTTELINGVATEISSGVANYEPVIGGDENPFRIPIEFTERSGIFGPADLMYTEEPLAESFFPAPSVGYSKVRVQTIHYDKKSANGYEESEYYTGRDFPTIVEYTPWDPESKLSYSSPWSPYRINNKNFVTLSQGFKVELNDMHGKMKSQRSYSMTNDQPLAYTQYYYRVEDDKAPRKRLSNTVMTADSASGFISTNSQIGKEVEIMVDLREQRTVTIAPTLSADVDVLNWWLPVLVPTSGNGSFNRDESRYRSIAITKVINRYGILDSVVVMDKGSVVSTKNLVYDAETGEVLISRTNNEFDDPVYNMTYPAHWAYSGLGPAYKNQNAVVTGSTIRYFKEGRAFTPTQFLYRGETVFESGDELWVSGTFFNKYTDTCVGFLPDAVGLQKTAKKLWVIDAEKGVYKNKGLYFIDKDGKPVNAIVDTMRVIRSGKRNMADNPVGSITSLGNPIRLVAGKNRIVIDSTINIIAASAGQYRDRWKTENTLFAKDTVLRIYQDPKLMETELYPSSTITLRRLGQPTNRLSSPIHIPFANDPYQLSAYHNDWSNNVRDEADGKGYMLFNFSPIPVGAQVISARLNLYAHTTDHELFSWRNKTETHQPSYPHIPFPPPSGVNEQNRGRLNRIAGFPTKNSSPFELEYHFYNEITTNSKVFGPAPNGTTNFSDANAVNVDALVQDMLNARTVLPGTVRHDQGLKLQMDVPASDFKRLCFYGVCDNDLARSSTNSVDLNPEQEAPAYSKYTSSYLSVRPCNSPKLLVRWYKCPDNAQPEYVNGELKCYSLKDTFVCRNNISDTMFNPYRWGVLGNWRMDRAYTYYGQRKQQDVAAATPVTNIRKDGEIRNFIPYWALNANGTMSPSADTMRWVWNSEMTLFNRKGYEIENRDPLNRFTAAQYGYNQTLPVAITQNSKNRMAAFDGFEDQDYKNEACIKCTPDRFFDLGTASASVSRVTTTSHTGIYSLKVNGNSTGTTNYSVVSAAVDNRADSLLVKVDSSALIRTYVNGLGTGLNASYYRPSSASLPCYSTTNLFASGYFFPVPTGPGCPATGNESSILYEGWIQAPQAGNYIFSIRYTGVWAQVFIDGVQNGADGTSVIAANSGINQEKAASITIPMNAGQSRYIKIKYYHNYNLLRANGYVQLLWKTTILQPKGDPIPFNLLYAPGSTLAQRDAAKKNDTTWCVKLRRPTMKNGLLPKFSPLQSQKILVSAWVKEDGPCLTGTYNNSQMVLSFTGGATVTRTLKPTGKIIEGWQRIEDTLTIPATATQVSVQLKATSATAVYFDDVRIHPYNANMKSFVYDPVTIRLMAELDENNYASFYEYDDDGTLIRVKKETERGVKTIRETRSALLKE